MVSRFGFRVEDKFPYSARYFRGRRRRPHPLRSAEKRGIMHRPKRAIDLLAFVAVLVTVVVAMAGLYGAWLGVGRGGKEG